MPITPLPNPPSRTDPINFSNRADAFVDALANTFVPEANALENSIIASVSSATSTTSQSMTLGLKTFTVQTGKSFGVNSWLSIVSTSDPSKGMIGQVQSYNPDTGSLVVDVTIVTGTGSDASWFLHYTHPQTILALQAGLAVTGANTFTGAQTLPGNATNNLHAVPKQQLDSGLLIAAPPGMVAAFATNTAPEGWLKANGALVSRTTYAALFAAIGEAFGVGDGSTTFALPDLRAEFIRGLDDSRGVDPSRALGSFQNATRVLENWFGQSGRDTISDGGLQTAAAAAEYNSVVNTFTGTETRWTGSNGGTQQVQTWGMRVRPRNIAMLYCIKF